MKTDTPRTDVEYLFKKQVSENPCDPNEHSEWMTSLCRELERENARLLRDMVLHERALEKAIEREDKLLDALRDVLMETNGCNPSHIGQDRAFSIARSILSNATSDLSRHE